MRMWTKLVLFAVLAAGVACIKPLPESNQLRKSSKVDDGDAAKYLLPETVVPSTYTLQLTTHIEKFDTAKPDSFGYEGTVAIAITTSEERASIILHKHDSITITKATLVKKDDPAATMDLDFSKYTSETNHLELTNKDTTNPKIPIGDYTLTIEFTGIHGDDMHGFYRSSYNEDKTDRWLVTTQFESYDARRAFPCFDEPKYKAKYTIWVTISSELKDKGYHVLSNMDADGVPVDNKDGTFTYKFKESAKKISSYLVAFIVSDFKSSEPSPFEDGKKTQLTWGRESYIKKNFSSLSQIAGTAGLDVLSKKLGITFAYPKMDQVGIPDFSAGAMENWGLCTYRERMIFFDSGSQTTATKQSNVMVTVHEFAHQWFGDLVTLHWWSDIWLNEGFATFFEFHATAEIATKELNTSTWQVIGQMVTDEVQLGALTVDAEPTSRPLTSDAYAPGDIDANFDDVAYSKGGSVIRMWMHALGEKKFYQALTNYLNDNTEDVGTPEKLLAAFESQTVDGDLLKGQVSAYFADWHKQAGYPVVILTPGDNKYTLSQERFLASGEKVATKWTIPITYTTSNKPDFTNTTPAFYLTPDAKSPEIARENASWILLNIQETGFYRVHYDNDTWLALTETLATKPETIGTINRAQLIDDALWLARSTNNYLAYDIALNLTNYLVNEKELVPWKAALNGFNFLYGRLANSDSGEHLINFIRNILSKPFEDLSLTSGADDEHTKKILRGLIASWSCKLGLDACVDQAVEKFDGERAEIDTDLKSVVLCTGLRENGADTWDAIWNEFAASVDSSEQTMLISVLGCTKDEDSLKKFLAFTLEDTVIRKQDKSAVFSAVYNGNPENLNVALTFLDENLEKIAQSYGGLDPLGGLLKGIATKLGSNEDEVTKMNELRDKIVKSDNPLISAARNSAELAASIVKSNNEWVKSKEESLGAWLEANSATSTTFGMLALLLPAIVALLTSH